MSFELQRAEYDSLYGPTAGDRIRLGDTDLIMAVEADRTSYGNEITHGWGKNSRTGMMHAYRTPADSELDSIIVGAVIADPVLGIFKGDIGIKDGQIAGVGRAGNPDIMDGVDLVLGPNTNVHPAAGLIATPGAVDSHVHIYENPKLMETAIGSGTTTFIGAGLNHNGDFTIHKYFEAFEEIPINLGVRDEAPPATPPP